MSLFKIFDLTASALNAQSIRLNTVASNLANAESVSGTEEGAYKARMPVFQAMVDKFAEGQPASVQVTDIVESQEPAKVLYEPSNPLANKDGNVFLSNVNAMNEMANMMSASRSYQMNVEVANTSRQLLLQTLRLGQ